MQKKLQIFVVLIMSVMGLSYADGGCNLCTPNNIPNAEAPVPAISQDENMDDMEEIYEDDDETIIIEEEETETVQTK